MLLGVIVAAIAITRGNELTRQRAEVCGDVAGVRAPDAPWWLLIVDLLPLLMFVIALGCTILARGRSDNPSRVQVAATLVLVLLVPAMLFGLLIAGIGVLEMPGHTCHHGG
jgi:hypothetical protein